MVVRALAAVERSRVALILVDATVGFTEQDSKVAGYAHDQGKACIIVVNKWDAVEGKETNTDVYKRQGVGLEPLHGQLFKFFAALVGRDGHNARVAVQQLENVI